MGNQLGIGSHQQQQQQHQAAHNHHQQQPQLISIIPQSPMTYSSSLPAYMNSPTTLGFAGHTSAVAQNFPPTTPVSTMSGTRAFLPPPHSATTTTTSPVVLNANNNNSSAPTSLVHHQQQFTSPPPSYIHAASHHHPAAHHHHHHLSDPIAGAQYYTAAGPMANMQPAASQQPHIQTSQSHVAPPTGAPFYIVSSPTCHHLGIFLLEYFI